jgi:predicted nucleotidyltransferase
MSLLLGSKLREKVLSYSLAHPGENYYVRELSGLIDEDPGNLSRELKKLEREGLLISLSKGKEKYYSLNKNYPLLPELKKIISKTVGVEGILRDLVAGFKGISLSFIHGSYAKGKEKKTSDIDLVVVGKFSEKEFTHQIRRLESGLNREINFTSYTEEDFLVEKNKEGGFLNLVTKEKTIILKGSLDAG